MSFHSLTKFQEKAREKDPASLPYPPTLPVEIALRQSTVKQVCEAYGIDQTEWNRLRFDPMFQADVKHWADELKKEGMSFKIKARLQSEELLKTSWAMIHAAGDAVPPNVKADLIKFTVRAAGLDGSKDQGPQGLPSNALQINLILA